MDKENIKTTSSTSTWSFAKEVGKYFMEFLETDFHKRKLPRRNIRLHNSNGLLTGFNINKYPSFYKVAYKLINNDFNSDGLEIQKGMYKADLPTPLLDLVKKQINSIDESKVDALVNELIDSIQQSAVSNKDNYLEAYNSVMENASRVFKNHIILDLVKNIEKPLEDSNLADENSIFQIEEELTNIFTEKISGAVSESLKLLISGNDADLGNLLKEELGVEDVQSDLSKFFEMFKVSDLFNELHELYQNFKIEDKQEFYLYFYDLTYQKNKYPIFYIPFSIERSSETFHVSFDSQIYINKKALAYIAQEHNRESGKKGFLKTIDDRIIYLADHEQDLPLVLQETLTEITNFFSMDSKLLVEKPEIQKSKSLFLTGSTNIYIALFDKSDEALLNDYEDILNATEDSTISQGFQTLIENFTHNNPESIAKPIRDEWDDKSVDEKLVYQSPIPLNSEQQQIISAINNKKCRYVLVEGPPGTGKSHTITAIVFNTILQNKSVLVLSDKKEAIDVVEKNITKTLNKVRINEKFQNPILRLGKTGNTYSRLLTQSSIDDITQQFRVVRSQYPNLNDQIDASIETLRTGVKGQVKAYGDISLKEVDELIALNKHFDKVGFWIDIDEAINNPHSVEELSKIRSILLKLKDKIEENKDISFNFDYTHNLSELTSEHLEEMIINLEDLAHLAEENASLIENEAMTNLYELVENNKQEVSALLEHVDKITELVQNLKSNKDYIKLLRINTQDLNNLSDIKNVSKHVVWLNEILTKVTYFAKDDLSLLNLFKESYTEDISKLERYIQSAQEARGLLGYLGKKNQVEQINQDFRKRFPLSSLDEPHKNLKQLRAVVSIYNYILELSDKEYHPEGVDLVNLVVHFIKKDSQYFKEGELNNITKLSKTLDVISTITENFSNPTVSIDSLSDLNNILVVSEIESLYKGLDNLLNTEKDLIEANIDLKKNETLETLFYEDNLNVLNKEIQACKIYVDTLVEINDDVTYLKETSSTHSKSFSILGIDRRSFSTLYENKLTKMSDLEFEKLTNFIRLHQTITFKFEQVKDLTYGERMRQIEEIVTMKMTYLMDERFVNFTNDFKADAKALKQVIKSKKRFPKEQFSKLKNAFPCILAGIRDYAEYIPLEPEIFDLVIIDEASQVSIAQAFPSLLRAKKVVVLGDNLQFSNVKSALARGDINKQYLGTLKEVFLRTVSEDTDKVARLEKFNIKVSILDFFGFINNYQARLVKHFRGYRELISYSNKIFYRNGLQVMKVRGVPVNSVIKFTQVNHDGLEELAKNTNTSEVEFIISELKNLKEQGETRSVGIITPHTNQQRFLYEKISDLPEADYLFETLNLKIMTFDTCQGEEMDIIFYSMVATEEDDKLNYVFISNLDNIELDDDEGKIKAQRLNVGLSRAKECMHFVLSKPIEQYKGTVKEFLQHYSNTLLESQKEPDASSVDQNSKMEPLVLEWIKQTKFWEENKSNAEILPQFELGKYLKQLDPRYNHPNYRVDFLLVYQGESDNHKIIIEYDGFMEHFGNSADIVNEFNYEHYYSPEDVYRQHILEGYGYRFIRINKFNLGDDPIATLDSRIQDVVKKNFTIMKL